MATPLQEKGLKSRLLMYIAAPMFTVGSLLIDLEDVKTVPYKDSGGITTVCVGSTANGPGHAQIDPHRVYTAQECAKRLEADLKPTFDHVSKTIKVPVTDGEKAAFVSFAFNVGVGAWDASSALKLLNAGNHLAACSQLKNWVYVSGRKVQGLVNRRETEYAMCVGKMVKP